MPDTPVPGRTPLRDRLAAALYVANGATVPWAKVTTDPDMRETADHWLRQADAALAAMAGKPAQLAAERLAEIADLRVDSLAPDAPHNPDVWALEQARHDLLAEVFEIHAVAAVQAEHIHQLRERLAELEDERAPAMADSDDLEDGCVFCGIVAGTEPARIVRTWPDATAFLPLNPVSDGHVLVIPNQHVADAVEAPDITAATMRRAAELAAGHPASNILTSIGAAATQSVFHLHLHVISRAPGDQLMVPWGTTGDPHAPHSCARAERAEAAAAKYRERAALLDALEAAGVDNWDGYGHAMTLLSRQDTDV